jgi:hypothetical protein
MISFKTWLMTGTSHRSVMWLELPMILRRWLMQMAAHAREGQA